MTKALVHDATGVDAIVRSAATGDKVAFARLVEAHHASMARVAYVICNDDDTTRDAVQSAWAIAWRRMSSLHDPGQVRPWLIAIAANEARQAMRRQRRSRRAARLGAAAAGDAESPGLSQLPHRQMAYRWRTAREWV